MSNIIQITSNNFNGQYADITFYPCSGGSINLGYQLLPYDYAQDNYEGTYDIYISAYTQTCQLVIACPSPTPTPTTTVTPTPTITPNRCVTYSGSDDSCCFNLTWIDCDGNPQSSNTGFFPTFEFCARAGSVNNASPTAIYSIISENCIITPTPTPTTTVTPTPSVTPTLTLTPSPVVEYHLQAENGDNILAENGDFIDIEHT